MSLSHFFSITQTWRIAISWLDTPGRILSSTWYRRWLQLVTPMRQNAQKRSRKFCRSKEDKNGETHPKSSKKGETGCVLGAGGDENGCEQVRTDRKDRKARRNSWDGLVSAAASVGPGRSPPGCRPPRHALRRAQPCLVAESLCALTKNREASIVLASLFLAGAEGLEPSARGFGVDVGKHTRERGKGRCHPILAASHKTGGAGLVLRPQKEGRGRLIPATSRFCTPPPRPAWRPGWA